LAESLQALMAARELSDNKLAELSGVSQPTVTRIRRGMVEDPKHATLERLAAALGVTMPELRGRRESAPPSDAFARTSAERALLEAWRGAPFHVRGAVLTLLAYASQGEARPAGRLDAIFEALMQRIAAETREDARPRTRRKAE